MHTRIKICCIASLDEAQLAIRYGADALGLVGAMPSGPGPIDDRTIADIARFAPPTVATFLLTSHERAADIVDHARQTCPSTVQIVRHVDPAQYEVLRARLPGTKLVQVIHVEDVSAYDLAGDYARYADALLLDSGRPTATTAELGGTGRTHDWSISRRIVAAIDRPVFLAGGLTPDNVGEAIEAVRPFGVDLCSGIRIDDRLDEGKLAKFVSAVHQQAGPGAATEGDRDARSATD